LRPIKATAGSEIRRVVKAMNNMLIFLDPLGVGFGSGRIRFPTMKGL
jgi:hypothetical protein